MINKDLDKIVANSPDGLKNNPIFKELVEKVIKDKGKSVTIFLFLLLISFKNCYIMVLTFIER